MLKVLNLYAGIGGNRKLWQDVNVTAVEFNPKIAAIYQDFFPNDKVIVVDAHEYLLKHFEEFDFIWSSPPCPTHSAIRRCGVYRGQNEVVYPDMILYQEIILLKYFSKSKWVVENVKPYYKLLIQASEIGRHMFWSNFHILSIKIPQEHTIDRILGTEKIFGFDIKNTNISNKRQVLRNLVNPKLGLHILNESKRDLQPELFRNI